MSSSAALRRNGGDAQLDVERAELLELDLAVLRLAPLGDVEVAHDLRCAPRSRCGSHAGTEMYGCSEAVLAEADLGLALAGIRLDVNVRRALLVGVDDDLVDELDDLVVVLPRIFMSSSASSPLAAVLLHVGQEVADRFAVHRRPCVAAEQLVERLRELVIAADAVGDLALRVDVVDDAASRLSFSGIGRQHDHAVLGVVDRHPEAALEELPVQVLEELERLDAIRLERLVRNAEIGGERLADRARA